MSNNFFNTMDWTTIITTFLSSGVFLGLFLITERKTSAAMKNTQSQSAEWQKLYEEEKEDNDRKDLKIAELNREKDQLREERDSARSDKARCLIAASKLDVLRCDCLSCKDRRPPLDFSKVTSLDMAEVVVTEELKSINDRKDALTDEP